MEERQSMTDDMVAKLQPLANLFRAMAEGLTMAFKSLAVTLKYLPEDLKRVQKDQHKRPALPEPDTDFGKEVKTGTF